MPIIMDPVSGRARGPSRPASRRNESLAGFGEIALRALILAAAIGAGLTLFNQRGALFGPRSLDLLSMGLAFGSPFMVVIFSQLLGIRAFGRERGRPAARRPESFWATLAGHGIALRAFVTALVVGTALTAIMTMLARLDIGLAGRAPLISSVQIAQVYALPLIFGAVSQALSYRRARSRVLSRSGAEAGHAD